MQHQQRPYYIADMFSHRQARLGVSQWILRDSDECARKEYVRAAYEIFLQRLEALKNPEGDLSGEEEAELRFMFDALIAAKHL